MTARCLLSCEHASNAVPARYRQLFRGHHGVLDTHRGYDPGTKTLGDIFRQTLGAPLYRGEVSRLLVELNRSLGHPSLFSEYSRVLDATERETVLNRYYHPYRDEIRTQLRRWIGRRQPVVHLSLHSFTPELHGEVRNAEIGLLYDPCRKLEQRFCLGWQHAIRVALPDARVRRNYPYQGKADGFTTALRREFPESMYIGIELEVNQKLTQSAAGWKRLAKILSATFAAALPSSFERR